MYSPPIKEVPIWLAAGGPKSSHLAAEFADGVMISVKNPEDAYERVINVPNIVDKNIKPPRK